MRQRIINAVDSYLIRFALMASGGNKTAAALKLGIPRQTVHERAERLGIFAGTSRPGDFRAEAAAIMDELFVYGRECEREALELEISRTREIVG